jgi:hypothetical protein
MGPKVFAAAARVRKLGYDVQVAVTNASHLSVVESLVSLFAGDTTRARRTAGAKSAGAGQAVSHKVILSGTLGIVEAELI